MKPFSWKRQADRKRSKSRKLTVGMVRVILTSWIIPYIILSSALVLAYSKRSQDQIGRTVCTAMENAGRITADKINAAIEDSRQASYDGVIKKSYEQYLQDGDEGAMHRQVSEYLNKTYKYSKTISNTILLYRTPMTMEYYTYSNVAGATYASIDEFRSNTAQAVRLAAKDLDTRTRLIEISGHLYVVRNIVRSNYEPFTTLVMEINMDRLFEAARDVIWKKSGVIVLDNRILNRTPVGLEDEKAQALLDRLGGEERTEGEPRDGEMLSEYDSKGELAFLTLKVNEQLLYFVYELDHAQLFGDRAAFLSVYIVVFITLIPLLIAVFYYFYTNINQPIGALVKGSERIRKGEYGYCVEPFHKNEEIGQLVDTFNHMSVSLEDSFNRIYVEEIAEREATLKALESQINPHFLNNTLEIINWKARMNGNEDVSEMISALSVMMNATLNRGNEMFIPLSEELSYVDAYLYIIRQRFGSKFRFEKQVDEDLLRIKVPRLIIQPVVENAVEHGGDKKGQIVGRLNVYADEQFLYISVENNGELSAEDREKIRVLLQTDQQGDVQGLDRARIGIRNVNLRLHLIYGGESGLSITQEEGPRTVCLLKISRQGSSRVTADGSEGFGEVPGPGPD